MIVFGRGYSRILWGMMLGFWGLLAAGCSMSQAYPDRAAFALSPGHPEKAAGAGATLTVRVMPVRIAKPFDSQLFSYKVGADRFTQDYYAGFVAPPESLLGAEMMEWLEESGAVKYAVAAGTPMDCGVNLVAQVSALYADHTNKTAVIEMRVFLVADGAGPTRVLLEKDYRETEPLGSLSPEALAGAWSAAYRRILVKMTADVGAVSGEGH